MMLKDLGTHEEKCPDRNIKCPWPRCGKHVKLNSFERHAPEHTYAAVGGMRLVWEILKYDVSLIESSMGGIKALKELFYVNLSYHRPSKCFVFSVWLAESQDMASKYIANLVKSLKEITTNFAMRESKSAQWKMFQLLTNW